jgi:hypothetical protein
VRLITGRLVSMAKQKQTTTNHNKLKWQNNPFSKFKNVILLILLVSSARNSGFHIIHIFQHGIIIGVVQFAVVFEFLIVSFPMPFAEFLFKFFPTLGVIMVKMNWKETIVFKRNINIILIVQGKNI